MAVIKCSFNHFYDNEKFEICPHCLAAQKNPSKLSCDEITVYLSPQEQSEVVIHKISNKNTSLNMGEDEKTISLFTKKAGYDPVVGWLVCVCGNGRGREFRIHSGRNFVGRSHSSDIAIVDDTRISRKNHCSVVYDSKKNDFLIVPGEGTSTYLNKNLILKPELIVDDDVIELGKSSFVFIAFCKKGRKW